MSTPRPFSRRQFVQGAAATSIALGGTVLLAGSSLPALAAGPDFTTAQLMAGLPLKDLLIGKPDAPVSIIEYASMTCPHCAAFAAETFPKLKSDYIDAGKASYVLREFPLDPLATAAFMLARYAGDDKRNDITQMLFARQKDWVYVDKQIDALSKLMIEAGLTQDQFDKCLADKALYDNVNKMRDIAADTFKVNSTPTFFINGKRHEGDFGVDELANLIKA